MSVKLRVNPILCQAHGMCAELLPELIELDEWGYPIVDGKPLPPELVGRARRAASFCPRLALALYPVSAPAPAKPVPPRPASLRRAYGSDA